MSEGSSPRLGEPASRQADPWAIDRVTLRFADRVLEGSFQAAFARQNVSNLRVGSALGAILWVVWGALVRGHLGDQLDFDSIFRYGVFIPLALLGVALTFWRGHLRFWRGEMAALGLVTWPGLDRVLDPDHGDSGRLRIR